jgi:hypothetical protein
MIQVVGITVSGPADEGGEEPVERLDIHRPPTLAAFEEVSEAVKLGVGQRVVLGEDSHRHFQIVSATVYDTTLDWLAVFQFGGS